MASGRGGLIVVHCGGGVSVVMVAVCVSRVSPVAFVVGVEGVAVGKAGWAACMSILLLFLTQPNNDVTTRISFSFPPAKQLHHHTGY